MNMITIAWLFPILFMLHDFEEIILVKAWRKHFQKERTLSPMKKKPFDHFKGTASFSIGVEIIFLTLSLITLFSVLTDSYFIWFSMFLAIIIHFAAAHIRQAVQFGHYTPGSATSVLFLPVGIWLLYEAAVILKYTPLTVLLSGILGIVISVIIFYTLTGLEGFLERMLEKYAGEK